MVVAVSTFIQDTLLLQEAVHKTDFVQPPPLILTKRTLPFSLFKEGVFLVSFWKVHRSPNKLLKIKGVAVSVFSLNIE